MPTCCLLLNELNAPIERDAESSLALHVTAAISKSRVNPPMRSPVQSASPLNQIIEGDSVLRIKEIPSSSVHLILSDIPYGIGAEDWDVLHDNTNSAYMGSSPAQEKAGAIFKKRGKPINGWSEADREIPKQYYDWCSTWAADGFVSLIRAARFLFLLAVAFLIGVSVLLRMSVFPSKTCCHGSGPRASPRPTR